MYFDPIYLYFAIPGLIISFLAQMYVKYSFNKYSRIPSSQNLNGVEIAEKIRDGESLPVEINIVNGNLNDSFDPRKDIVNISSANVSSSTIANIAVIAHEFGHVQQKFNSALIYRIRQFLVPVTQIGTQIGYVLFFIGLAFSILNLAEIGLIFFSTSTLFALVTLPVEFDASKRAMTIIKKYNLIDGSEIYGAKQVLNAAAMTYVAGLLSSILNLLYYTSILNRRR